MKSFKTYLFIILISLSFNSQSRSNNAPASFADLAEKLMPSVVNISTTTIMGTTICKCFEISLLKEKYLRIFLQLAFLHFTIWMSLLFSFVRNIQNLVTRNIWVLSATVAKVIPYFDSHRSGRDSLSRCSAQENCRKLQHSFVIQWDAWLVNNLPIGVQLSSVLKHYLCYKVTENMFSFA